VSLPDLDQPDDALGCQDPFVNAVTAWSSFEVMQVNGFPAEYIEDVVRSVNAMLTHYRRTLVEQYVQAPLFFRTPALRRQLGLEYWGDGEVLASNDPDRRSA
jgi:hypothetical protein